MARANCWEVKGCGREPDGPNVAELGVCPAATDTSCHGIHGGTNAGRLCWAVSGTFCDGVRQGTFAQKRMNCMTCEFFRQVKEDEGPARFQLLKPG